MGIIVGLGTGRSGTLSLSKLISSQDNSVCFHEINPSAMQWKSSRAPVLSMIREFSSVLNGGPRDLITIDYSVPNRAAPLQILFKLNRVDFIGEIGFYYLNYVEDILKLDPTVKFPCIKRDRSETVLSYANKMYSRSYVSTFSRLLGRKDSQRNHFMEHDGKTWKYDPIWDKCYPKFDADTLEEAIGKYWDSYYAKAEELSLKYDQVKIFQLEDMNKKESQKRILEFCGYDKPRHVEIHANQSK